MTQQNVIPFFVEDHIVIEPTQKHTGTLIVLHGITSCGKDMKNLLVSMIFPSVKYIFPAAPTRYISSNNIYLVGARYDALDESEDVKGIMRASQAVQKFVKN
jgi:predicted esterase